jgi:hypothetical protein
MSPTFRSQAAEMRAKVKTHDAGQGAIPQPNHVSPTFGAQQVAEPGARMAVREHAD